jgi:hypothetical protein
MDATKFAATVAEKIHDNLFQAHRGSVRLGRDRVVIFGNDGYGTDPLTRVGVGLVHEWLAENGHVVEAEARCSGDYTWVIIFRPAVRLSPVRLIDLVDAARVAVWDAWQRSKVADVDPALSSGFRHLQENIAYSATFGVNAAQLLKC